MKIDRLSRLSGFPGGSVVQNPPANAGDVGLNPWVRKIPWKREWQPTPVFLLGKIIHGAAKSWTRLSG